MVLRPNNIIIFLYLLKISINLRFQCLWYRRRCRKSNARNSSTTIGVTLARRIYVYHRSIERARKGSSHDRRSISAQIMHCLLNKEAFLARNALYHVPSRHDSDTKIKATSCRKNGNGRCLRDRWSFAACIHACIPLCARGEMFKLWIRINFTFAISGSKLFHSVSKTELH